MRKRYNYFDDDFDEQGNIKIQQNPWAELKDKLVATIKNLDCDTVLRILKRVASTIGIIILLSCKKIASSSHTAMRSIPYPLLYIFG